MATERSHNRKLPPGLLASAALAQLFLSHCHQDSPGSQSPDSSMSSVAAVSGSGGSNNLGAAGSPDRSGPDKASATGGAGAAAMRSTPSAGAAATSTSNTPPANTAAATSSTAGRAAAQPPQAGATSATAGASGATDMASPSSGTTLPAVSDFKAAGPFTPKRDAGPNGYVLYYPQELGKDGVKHPIVSWGPGAAETAADFSILLSHLASHGFAVISFDGTPQGQELVMGIDWMLEQNSKAGSTFFQKLDETKISAGGHSAGSLATFVIGGDKRLVTTLHISGGTFDPHTDIRNLHAPALFVCGEAGGDGLLQGDVANPNCEIDFNNAMVPVFYGITKGAAHMTPTDIGDPALRTHQFGAIVGWLRWQLASDAAAKSMFVGDSCALCKDSAWSTAKQKNLD